MGCLYFWTERLLRGLTLGFNGLDSIHPQRYKYSISVFHVCLSRGAKSLRLFIAETDVRSSVWSLLVHLFLSGGLTAVLSVSLLASKRLSLLV
ncbi:hypothetical protein EMCRGX_G021414 [Ephydatia muelleri]